MIFISNDVIYGPFKNIEVLPNSLRCDGVDYQFTVIGDYELSEDDSLVPAPVMVEDVPEFVAMWQARDVLIADSLMTPLMGVLNGLPEPTRSRALSKFEYSNTVRRDDPLVTQILPLLGVSSADADQLFIRANKLV